MPTCYWMAKRHDQRLSLLIRPWYQLIILGDRRLAFESNPIIFGVITIGLLNMLKQAGTMTVTVDLDVLLLCIWGAFCINLNLPGRMISRVQGSFALPRSQSSSNASDIDGRKLLSRVSQVLLSKELTINCHYPTTHLRLIVSFF